jgi:hypothetical protein
MVSCVSALLSSVFSFWARMAGCFCKALVVRASSTSCSSIKALVAAPRTFATLGSWNCTKSENALSGNSFSTGNPHRADTP